MTGDCARRLVRWREGQVAVGSIGFNDRDDLVGIALEDRLTDSVVGVYEFDWHPVWGKRSSVIDVVHSFERWVLPAVHLKDHLVGAIQPCLVVAHGRRRDERT